MKRIISVLLAMLLLVTVLPLSLTAAAEGESTVTVVDWDGTKTVQNVKVGDEITVSTCLTLPEGKRLDAVELWETYNVGGDMLEVASDIENGTADMCPILGDPTVNNKNNIVKANFTAAKFAQSCEFPDVISVLIKVKYKVIAEGNSKINIKILKLKTISEDDSAAVQVDENKIVGTDALTIKTVFGEPKDESTVTIVDWDGTETVKEVNVGDVLDICSYLTLPAGTRLSAIELTEQYNVGSEMLTLLNESEPETMLPIISSATVNVADNTIKAVFTTAKFADSKEFSGGEDMLIKATYRVESKGACKVKLNIIDLATVTDDDAVKSQIIENKKVGSDEITLKTMDISSPSEEKVLVGDVNLDKQVNNRDAMILDRYVAGWADYDKNIKSTDAADLNRDKQINNRDAMILDRYVAGWADYDKYIIEV